MVGGAVVAVEVARGELRVARKTGQSERQAIEAEAFVVEQMQRDRRREVWAFCDELALVSRYSPEVAERTAEQWRTVLQTVARTGRVVIEDGFVRYVVETAAERRAELSQGVLFQ